jgi:hypothetical protein
MKGFAMKNEHRKTEPLFEEIHALEQVVGGLFHPDALHLYRPSTAAEQAARGAAQQRAMHFGT